MNHLKTLSTATLISLSAGFAQAVPVTIYSEDFAGTGDLVGTAEDETGTELWTGRAGTWQADGSISNSAASSPGRGSALLAVSLADDMIYTAEASFTFAETDPALIMFGFSQLTTTDRRFHNQAAVNGIAFMGLSRTLATVGNTGLGTYAGGGNTAISGPVAGEAFTAKVVVTTSSTDDWTAEYFLNGTSFGSQDLLASTDINYIGFSTNGPGVAGTGINSFTLSSEVPEPGSLALLGLGGLLMARRRRDN